MKEIEDYCPNDKKDWRKWLELNHKNKDVICFLGGNIAIRFTLYHEKLVFLFIKDILLRVQ